MSTPTLIRFDDDFDAWESEFAEPARSFRPTRAAERRGDREAIERELGIVRHRSHERRED